MSISKELMPNEQIIYKTKPHWIVFMSAIGWIAAAIAIYMIGLIYNLDWLNIGTLPPIHEIIAGLLLLFGFFSFLISVIHYVVTDYVITTRRVIMQTGLLHRETIGILLPKIEMIKVSQPLLGRIFKYGDVIIVGVGGNNDPFPNLPDPISWREKVQYQIQKTQGNINATYK